MEMLTVIIGIILAPISIKFIDKAYKSFKKTELYKDLTIED